MDQRVNEYLGDRYFEGVTVPVGNGRNVMTALAVVWTAGAVILLAYLAVSSLRMRLRLSGAVRVESAPFSVNGLRFRLCLDFSDLRFIFRLT